jgi:hypothetical protein
MGARDSRHISGSASSALGDPPPSERPSIASQVSERKARIQKVMLDLNNVDNLLSIWRTANNVDAEDRVDVITFKPLVTICEDGSVEDIADFDCLESPGLFSQLIGNPTLFHQFVLSHWKEVYSSLFVFHIQPVHEQFTCCAIHALQARNGKGTPRTVCKLKHELLAQRGSISLAMHLMMILVMTNYIKNLKRHGAFNYSNYMICALL